MTEVKVLKVSHGIRLSLGNEDKVFEDTETELNQHLVDGWKIVGVIPSRTYIAEGVVGGKGWFIELLRKIPIINFIINIIWPLAISSSENSYTGILLQKG